MKETFQVKENKKQKEKYIVQYIEEIENLLNIWVSIVNMLLRAYRVELHETIV